MAYEISISSSDPAPASRGFPWPVVEQGNASYPKWEYAVKVDTVTAGRSIRITHALEGAALIDRLSQDGGVMYICTVADPHTMYREVVKSHKPDQLLEWEPSDLGQHPIFSPMMVSAGDADITVSELDGVSQLWVGKRINLVKGSRLAVFPPFALSPGLGSLLRFELGADLSPGTFKVMASTVSEFKFVVSLSLDLFNHLKIEKTSLAHPNVMTHIVSSAFAILKQEYSNDSEEDGGWQSYESLRTLSAQMKDKGIDDWTSDNFDPAYAATIFHPHKIN